MLRCALNDHSSMQYKKKLIRFYFLAHIFDSHFVDYFLNWSQHCLSTEEWCLYHLVSCACWICPYRWYEDQFVETFVYLYTILKIFLVWNLLEKYSSQPVLCWTLWEQGWCNACSLLSLRSQWQQSDNVCGYEIKILLFWSWDGARTVLSESLRGSRSLKHEPFN